MDKLKLYSFNVRGLKSDINKRRKIFEIFKKKLNGIIFLQETHSIPEIATTWKHEWGGEIIFSHGTSRKKGTAILLPTNLDYKINNINKDPDGRYIILDITCLEETYILVNIYAPTQNNEKDQILLIQTIQNALAPYEGKNIIIGGDFNIVIEPSKDKEGGHISPSHTSKYRTTLKAFIETYELCDIWRLNNENKHIFTWHCKSKKIYCRLDFWLISEHLANMVDHTDVIPSVLSDHSIIQLSVRNPKLQPRGPGYWKFNTTLLRDKQYIKHIKQCIVKSEALHQYDDKAIEWELIKMDKDPLQYHTANIKNKKASNTKHI
jgi:exonuclease III